MAQEAPLDRRAGEQQEGRRRLDRRRGEERRRLRGRQMAALTDGQQQPEGGEGERQMEHDPRPHPEPHRPRNESGLPVGVAVDQFVVDVPGAEDEPEIEREGGGDRAEGPEEGPAGQELRRAPRDVGERPGDRHIFGPPLRIGIERRQQKDRGGAGKGARRDREEKGEGGGERGGRRKLVAALRRDRGDRQPRVGDIFAQTGPTVEGVDREHRQVGGEKEQPRAERPERGGVGSGKERTDEDETRHQQRLGKTVGPQGPRDIAVGALSGAHGGTIPEKTGKSKLARRSC